VLTPFEIAEAIEAETDRMEGLLEDLKIAAIAAAQAEVDYGVKFAQARLSAKMTRSDDYGRITVNTADDLATVATEGERYTFLLAKNHVMVVRESIRASHDHIEALRTLSASSRNAP
jgi:hypothetical protein